jgi:hypothetical protein
MQGGEHEGYFLCLVMGNGPILHQPQVWSVNECLVRSNWSAF